MRSKVHLVVSWRRRQPCAERRSDVFRLGCMSSLWLTGLLYWLVMLLLLLLLWMLFAMQPVEAKFRRPLCRQSYTIDEIYKIAEILEAFVMVGLRLIT